MEPLISVIVPAYNIEEYIGRCIESIRNQTHKNLEIIIVDDGSTDGTGDMLDRYAQGDDRIVVIHQENGGVSNARNTALAVARGEYIGFVDGDDIADNDMFALLMKTALSYDADISICGLRSVYPIKTYHHCIGETLIFDQGEGINALLNGGSVSQVIFNKLYKAKLFKDIRFDETIRNGEDTLVNFYLFSKSNKAVRVGEAKYSYIKRLNSATHKIKMDLHMLRDPYIVATEILGHCNPQSKAYWGALNRRLKIMLHISEHRKSALKDADCVLFQKGIKQELRREMRLFLKGKGVKRRLKGELIGLLYLYPLYYLARSAYKFGSEKKVKPPSPSS